MTADRAWMADAACVPLVGVWDTLQHHQARQVCEQCPALDRCREYADSHDTCGVFQAGRWYPARRSDDGSGLTINERRRRAALERAEEVWRLITTGARPDVACAQVGVNPANLQRRLHRNQQMPDLQLALTPAVTAHRAAHKKHHEETAA